MLPGTGGREAWPTAAHRQRRTAAAGALRGGGRGRQRSALWSAGAKKEGGKEARRGEAHGAKLLRLLSKLVTTD